MHECWPLKCRLSALGRKALVGGSEVGGLGLKSTAGTLQCVSEWCCVGYNTLGWDLEAEHQVKLWAGNLEFEQ